MTTNHFELKPAPTASVSWILGQDALPAHIDPEQTAVRWVDGSLTYAELRSRARSLARSLRERGARPGDRVAVHLFNRGEIFELYFACAFAGLTMVPINFRLSPREIALIVDDCRPMVFVTETELHDIALSGIAASGHDVESTVVLEPNSGGIEYDALTSGSGEIDPAHAAAHLLLYTSGTTGRPKGVIITHDGILAFAMQQCCFYDGLDSTAVLMVTGPMYNTAAIHEQSIPTFLAGGTVVIMPSRGWHAARMAELMDQWSVTHALIYPSMIEPLLAASAEQTLELSSLKFALTGGENCPPAAMRKFMDRWPHVILAIAYGSTETGVISMIKNEQIRLRPGSVGRSMGAQTFRVLDIDGRPSGPNEVGVIWTAGPTTANGYWQAPELDAAVFVDGWVNTGDLGRIDEEGYLYIDGRAKDMIISKGQNIYPAEIENVLREHPLITDVAVIGVPDEEFGEAVCACVVLRPGVELTLADVHEFTRDSLASFKKPRHLSILNDLPRNPSGKILKKQLPAAVAGLSGQAR